MTQSLPLSNRFKCITKCIPVKEKKEMNLLNIWGIFAIIEHYGREGSNKRILFRRPSAAGVRKKCSDR